MIIRADYHFHPNLSKKHFSAIRKVKNIYKKCAELGINCLLITEHSYKKPRRAFDYMKKLKPDNFYIFPGLEYVTRDKIDIIIFSASERIYDYPELKSFRLNYEELVDFVCSKPDLQAFVTHPFTLGGTGVVKRKGIYFTQKMINKLGAVEICYTAFSSLKQLVRKLPASRNFFKSSVYKIGLNEFLPQEFYPEKLKFVAVGSDAHHVKQIGNFCEIEIKGQDNSEKKVFKALVSSKSPRIFIAAKETPYLLIRSGITTFSEFFLKERVRLGLKIKKRIKLGRKVESIVKSF